MNKAVIELKGLTKDYGGGRGIFGIDLSIYRGETMGFVGTNGSGKTTTIRNIMGFIEPTSGSAAVNGLEAWSHSSEIVKSIGYVPGEIAFPDLPTGTAFLKSQAGFLNLKSMDYANALIEKLQLDPSAPLKRMSKGMKQKTAVVAALMADPPILVFDEPTTGLDPLMREAFLDIIRDEHSRGKTIFMSSHMFGELESTADRVALIRNGHIIDLAQMDEIRNKPEKEYKIEFVNAEDYLRFKKLTYRIIRDQPEYNQATIAITEDRLSGLFRDLDPLNVKFISENKYTLERHFEEVIKKERDKNVQ